MSDFKYDKRDLEFNFFEMIGSDKVTALEPYQDFSDEIFKMVLDESFKFAAQKLWPRNRPADEEGCKLEDGQVKVPAVYEEIYDDFRDAGWYATVHSPEYGGQGLPTSLGMVLTEAFIAANPSFMFFPGLGVAAGHLIETFGTEEDKATYVEKMYNGQWGGTMCLTEPSAGSAVGELRSTAEPVDGQDYYEITGNKIFISAGDHQLAENIVHLVLARVKGDPAGTKGISLFIVPKFIPDADGNPGERNDVAVTGIEHKMGIHASPTCSLAFGDHGSCKGWLVGERCKGIVYMFQMMNEARLVTGLQGVALGNAAFQLALDYARERHQGPKVTNRSPDAQSVAIIEHPDVRRMLMTMKAYSEAIRGLLIQTAWLIDKSRFDADEAEAAKAQDLVDLLTPICKAFASDVGFKITELAMQTLGGYGYIAEYVVEQYMRDVKIASIYEGTNGIQALDLLGRKMRMKQGALFMNWIQETSQFIETHRNHAFLAPLIKELDAAKNALGEAAFGFMQSGKENPEYPLLHATPFLRMFGLVESARILDHQAAVAYEKLEGIWAQENISADDRQARAALVERHDDARFYENKLLTAQFYTHQILPEFRPILTSIQSNDTSALDAFL